MTYDLLESKLNGNVFEYQSETQASLAAILLFPPFPFFSLFLLLCMRYDVLY
jgi:hypothetical protein